MSDVAEVAFGDIKHLRPPYVNVRSVAPLPDAVVEIDKMWDEFREELDGGDVP